MLLFSCRDHFYSFGEIVNISLSGKARYAFITFSTRAAAEKAADATFNKLIVKGVCVCVCVCIIICLRICGV